MICQNLDVGQASQIEFALLNGPLYSHAFKFDCLALLLSRRQRAEATLYEEVLSSLALYKGEP